MKAQPAKVWHLLPSVDWSHPQCPTICSMRKEQRIRQWRHRPVVVRKSLHDVIIATLWILAHRTNNSSVSPLWRIDILQQWNLWRSRQMITTRVITRIRFISCMQLHLKIIGIKTLFSDEFIDGKKRLQITIIAFFCENPVQFPKIAILNSSSLFLMSPVPSRVARCLAWYSAS